MKVLIIGLGSIARKHIEALKDIGHFDIYALRSSTKSATYEQVINLYNYDEVGNYNFDFFIISNPTSDHAATIENILKFEKPLFIEKPVFNEVSIFNSNLVKKIKRRNISTYVGCNLRFLDCLKEAKKLVKDLQINEINSYAGSYLPDWRPGIDFKKNYSANKEMGGGVHMDLIHELDYLYWIFGEPLAVDSLLSSRSSLNINAIDYANYRWLYENFCIGVILNYYRRDYKRTLEIVSTEGTFLIDLFKNKIFKNEEEIFSSEQKIINTYSSQMRFFINNVLKTKNKDFNTVEEAYKILKLCLKE